MTLISSISGIRGTIGGRPGEGLTPVDIIGFTSAYSKWLIENGNNKVVVVGRDARISGSIVNSLVCSAFQSMGIDVIDIGLSTTPTVELAVTDFKAGGGVIITASHNPGIWNALKLLNNKGEFISASEGQQILEFAKIENFEFAHVDHLGTINKEENYFDEHIKKIIDLPLVDTESIKAADFRIAVDGINSSGAVFVPQLLKALGVEKIHAINKEPNGHFAHNPEPLPKHLGELSSTVKHYKADLGFAVDPDVDRLAMVMEDGDFFGEEYTLVCVADYILQHDKGSTVSNLSSSKALKDMTEKHEGSYHPAAVGEVNVVEKMKEVKAVIGGEGNGGVIYPALHYGRDALVGIALILSYLAKTGKSVSQLRNTYPNYHIVKQKIELTEGTDLQAILNKLQEKYIKYPLVTIDGVKIHFDEDWVHLRKSNTEPIIRIYAESKSEVKANNLAEKITADIRDYLKG